MKRYNKPVVEINGFEVEDIITISTASFGGDDADNTAYAAYVASPENGGEEEDALVFEW